jgi:hypothetical protein
VSSKHILFNSAARDNVSRGATTAATAEGFVLGGGVALLRVIDAVAREEANCTGDERTGLAILKRALEAPTRQIAENSGADDGVVVERIRTGAGNFGFDAARGEYRDLMEAGIIDPTTVVRIALENAVSVAGVLLLTKAMMTGIPEAKEKSRLHAPTTPERLLHHDPRRHRRHRRDDADFPVQSVGLHGVHARSDVRTPVADAADIHSGQGRTGAKPRVRRAPG